MTTAVGKGWDVAKRFDVVFIRKSSDKQDEQGQIDNVRALLKERGVTVDPEHWMVGTIKRRNVKSDPGFARLLELVENDRVGTIYVESQDRWGTADRCELFGLIGTLRWHETQLIDLRENRDLTGRDIGTELNVFVGSIKSEKELQDISYRSLRTRVNNFKDSGSWPTGPHPFGYAKACYGEDGQLRWEWHPVSRTIGELYIPDTKGKLNLTPGQEKIPRKSKGQQVKLIPNRNGDFVDSVRLVFDLYTRVGLSRRQISARLNDEGRKFYSRPWTHTFVTQVLTNPAYIGETHFGKMQSGELHTFDGDGLVVQLKTSKKKVVKKRDESDRIVRKDTHEPLIDRKTWDMAKRKFESEQERTSFAPRNPAYFLKQIFVCGHCGKGMTGRTETHPQTKEKTVIYVCTSYIAGRCNGNKVDCGYHRITHADAEKLLLSKLEEMGTRLDTTASDKARDNLERRLANLGHHDEETMQNWEKWIKEGVDAFAGYLNEIGQHNEYPDLKKMRKMAFEFYTSEPEERSSKVQKLRTMIEAAEKRSVELARQKVDALMKQLTTLTLKWAETTDVTAAIMKQKMDQIEKDIETWKSRMIPLATRLESLYRAEQERQEQLDQLQTELPQLDARERGEAFRRVFRQVVLYWDRKFHPATEGPRKTERTGRNSYTLQPQRFEWSLAPSNLVSSW
ncbi:recombinase family protein [Caulifigura coniformis]|uniref:recombinase family protein n=1 Tax=Caulifigura coniformis TaxID=2527983 RepID=UPI0018D271BC|nr:recombinase family protein [Caulifigura coniformis]